MTKRLSGGALALALAVVLATPTAATPPGQNGLLVWERATQRGLPHIWVGNPDGTAQRRVFARRGRGDFEGTFSTIDSSLVFFSRFREAPFSEDIYSGNLLTGDVTRVIGGRGAQVAPTVSPDGTRIAYFFVPRPRRIREDVPPPPERITIANVDGSGARFITPRRRRSIDPDWSPDGARLVYAEARFVGDTPQFRLMIINADGSGRQPLSRFGGPDEVNPKWMPHGQSLLFERWRQRGRRSDIVAMNPDGSGVRTILSTRAWETNPVPSPDGSRIVFTSDRDRRGRDRINPGFEIYTMAADGSDIVRVTRNRKYDVFPDWQRLP